MHSSQSGLAKDLLRNGSENNAHMDRNAVLGFAAGVGIGAILLRTIQKQHGSRTPSKSKGILQNFIGIDLGGTTITLGVVNSKGTVVAKVAEPLEDRAFDSTTKQMIRMAHCAVAQANLSLSSITAIGIGTPGNLDFELGVVKNAAAFSWKDAPLAAVVEAGTGRPTVIENDANAALLAEWWAGAGAGDDIRHIVMLTLGTGVGGAIVTDDKLLRGATGMAGELGHVIVEPRVGQEPKGELCSGTNVYGVFERYTSATAVAKRAKDLLREQAGIASSMRALGDTLDAKAVFEHAAQGDALAEQIVDSTAEYLGVGCINICRAFDPQVIVMTGGLALAGNQLFDKVRSWFNHHHWTIQPPTCRIVPAQTGNNAGMIGAAAAARIKFAS